MGIMDMFRTPPQQQGPQPNQQQAPQQQAGPAVPGSTMNQQQQPAGSVAAEGGGQSSNSPLDNWKDLWKNDSNSQGNPETDPFSSPLFSADPERIRETASKADFLSQLPQELIQKAMSGQDPSAFMEVINKVAQNSLATAVQLSMATVEQAGTRLGDRFKKATPGYVKDAQLSGMRSDNPVLQNPAAEPMLQMIRDRIRRNEPNLSAADIQKKAEQYLTTFAGELSGSNKTADASRTQSSEQDWLQWAGNSL
ncbi:MAG: hypothetical protein E6R04_10595 [Spirochaetes bacterium]|nr:MAG: hypothetical protein E6R04_10595 [Spirochaetota bacterium]